jgi:hypothetical protein
VIHGAGDPLLLGFRFLAAARIVSPRVPSPQGTRALFYFSEANS